MKNKVATKSEKESEPSSRSGAMGSGRGRLLVHGLRRPGMRYRELADSLPVTVSEFDEKGNFSFINTQGLKTFGYTREDIMKGLDVLDVIAPADRDRAAKSIQKALKGEYLPVRRYTMVKKDGTTFPATVYSGPIVAGGKVAGFRSIVVDNTEQRMAEEALRLSEQKYRHIFENAAEGVFQSTEEGRLLSVNPSLARLFGYGCPEEMLSSVVDLGRQHYVDPGERERLKEIILDRGSAQGFECEIRRTDGGTAWISLNARAVRGPSGGLLHFEGTFENITERKRMEQALKASEEKFSKAFNASPASVSIVTLKDGRFIDINEAFQEMLGYDRNEVIGRDALDLGIWTGMEHWEYVTRLLRDGKAVRNLEFRLRTKGGGERITLLSAELIELSGEPCVLKVAVDITERKRGEEALRRASAYNRSLIEAGLDPLVMIGPDGRISDVNSAAEHITGVERHDLIGTDFSDYFTETEKARAVYWRVFRDGQVRDYPLDLRHRDGKIASVLYNASVYWDEDGRVMGVAAAARDITERRQAEMRLRESEERYRIAIEHSNDGVAIMRGGRHLYVNRKFVEMFGYDGPDDIIGEATNRIAHPDDKETVTRYDRMRQEGGSAPSRYEFKGMRRDGSTIFVEASVASTVFRGQPASLAYLRDVTGRREMEEKLRMLSIVDELTGLYNRRGFLTLAGQQVRTAGRQEEPMAIFFIDCDDMKSINDTRGHQEGDRALISVANVLRRTFRESDIIGRMGGDEFAVLAPRATGRDREELTLRLTAVLDDHNRSHPGDSPLSLSVGFSLYDPARPVALEALITEADQAMYGEKKKKGGKRRGRKP